MDEYAVVRFIVAPYTIKKDENRKGVHSLLIEISIDCVPSITYHLYVVLSAAIVSQICRCTIVV